MLSDYDKGFFNPAFLIGVETTKGFITNVVEIGFFRYYESFLLCLHN